MGKFYMTEGGTVYSAASVEYKVGKGEISREDLTEVDQSYVDSTLNDVEGEIRSQRDELIDRVSREVERQLDNGNDATDWRTYRQFLRDLPEQTGFPENVDWGTTPGEFTGK